MQAGAALRCSCVLHVWLLAVLSCQRLQRLPTQWSRLLCVSHTGPVSRIRVLCFAPPAGNSTYLYSAYRHWLAAGGRKGHRGTWGGEVNPYISWDSLYAPAAVNLLR